jgi:Domain of unknown function (DUF3597)
LAVRQWVAWEQEVSYSYRSERHLSVMEHAVHRTRLTTGASMSIFDAIKNAIFGHSATPAPSAVAAAAVAPIAPENVQPAAAGSSMPAPDLDASLKALAAKNGQALNWQTSIVDLMKLVGLDSSLANRTRLAHELGYTGDTADSASMNIWLHKEVMTKLRDSGGSVPSSLK